MSYYGFRPYVPVAERREQAAREMAKLAKKGRLVSPILIEGRKITSTFWGHAWCENLERYSDYANRLPRGRTYVRNGSVVDLQIERGKVRAVVSGSQLYTIEIAIATLPKPRWEAICQDCSSSVGSLVELLQGKLSKNVMERVCRAEDGLFPSPGEIKLECSCPDWADMCKHVSAALYGVGARLDAKPDLLFELRGVDRSQLVAGAGKGLPLTGRPVSDERVLAEDDVAALFGIEMDAEVVEPPAAALKKPKLDRGVASTKKVDPSPKRDVKPVEANRAVAKTAAARAKPSTTAQAALSAPRRPAIALEPSPAPMPSPTKTARRVPILTATRSRMKQAKAR